jgi:hypothetical protein
MEKVAADADRAADRDTGTVRDVHYDNEQFGLEKGQTTLVPNLRTSLIVDPPDGKIPPQIPEAVTRNAAIAAARKQRGGTFDTVKNMSYGNRCIIMMGNAPPMLDPGYLANYQIIQSPGYVTILMERLHDARIIPLDGRPAPPAAVRLWEGDSRGRWEGDTLVVETTNFSDRNWIATSAASGRIKGIPQSTALKIVERFTLVAPDRLDYQARIEDPAVFTQPWTLAFPLMKDIEYTVYEYACHEGNRAVEGILRGARYQERTTRPRQR